MTWKNEQQLELWDKKQGTIGIDSDGDIGIMDAKYSIIFSEKGSKALTRYLVAKYPREAMSAIVLAIHAFMSESRVVQQAAMTQIKIIVDENSTEDEKAAAVATLESAFFD